MRWSRGEALIERLIDERRLQRVSGAQADGTALLAHQGLRPTTQGGHYAVEEAVRGQFGESFRAVGTLRRRRNELEYPTYPGDEADRDEVADAIRMARQIIEAAQRILPNLGVF